MQLLRTYLSSTTACLRTPLHSTPDGDLEAAHKVYCTTTVNFGDKPAGGITINTIKETADLFGGDGEAAYFLKNRTYVDDCVEGKICGNLPTFYYEA